MSNDLDILNTKLFVNGGCVSYDFVRIFKDIFHLNDLKVNYLFRVPFVNFLNSATDDILNLVASKINPSDFEKISSISKYFEKYNLPILSDSDVLIFDLYKELYPKFIESDFVYILGPDLNDANIYVENLTKLDEFDADQCFKSSVDSFFQNIGTRKIIFIDFQLINPDSINLYPSEDFYNGLKNSLEKYRNYIISHYSDCLEIFSIVPNDEDFSLDHQWGISPLHFSDSAWNRYFIENSHIIDALRGLYAK
jgi:hypothetical protein